MCVEQAQQPVPDWLEAEGEGGFGSGFSAGASNDFGGTDFRQNDVSAKHYYVFFLVLRDLYCVQDLRSICALLQSRHFVSVRWKRRLGLRCT